jgi:5-formyltetrahydrofolate cyclo-ligase
MNTSIEQLRSKHRKDRAALDSGVLQSNAISLQSRLEQLPQYRHATRIAAYIAIKGEIDLSQLMVAGAAQGKQFYLPILNGESMHFAAWNPGQELVKKGFGLLEPDVPIDACVNPRELDLVLAPLVVFDPQCNRIGQGGGFYDRTFAHRRETAETSPCLVGVAHQSQCENQLQPESWDVPLDFIVTDSATYER